MKAAMLLTVALLCACAPTPRVTTTVLAHNEHLMGVDRCEVRGMFTEDGIDRLSCEKLRILKFAVDFSPFSSNEMALHLCRAGWGSDESIVERCYETVIYLVSHPPRRRGGMDRLADEAGEEADRALHGRAPRPPPVAP